MKKLLLIAFLGIGVSVKAQNSVFGPTGVFGPANTAATTIFSGGSITIGSGGNLALSGNITSADKGNPNSPTATGRTEAVILDGGVLSGTTTTAGMAGNVVDGYITTTANNTVTLLPLGNASAAYPLTIPAAAGLSAAFFDGTGATITTTIGGNSAQVYTMYYDMPDGYPASDYAMSYLAGLTSTGTNAIVNATDNGSTFTLGANVDPIGATAGITTPLAALAVQPATRLYLADITAPLPIDLIGFTGKQVADNINLTWKTENAKNFSHFEVLKGTNKTEMGAIGKVNGTNASLYNFSDNNPIEGTNYYRLKMYDNNGSAKLSKILAIKYEKNSSYLTVENPVKSSDFIFTTNIQFSTCVMHSTAGQNVAIKLEKLGADKYKANMSSAVPNGLYYFSIISDEKAVTKKIMIIK